jgi:transcriptional regulator with XRE-family HTH domain
MVTSAQLRAARSLLNWTVRDLAERSGVHRNTITRAETEANEHGHAVAQVVRTLEIAGVIFVPGNGEGPGVRLKKIADLNSDEALIARLDIDEIWLVRHEGIDKANSLRQAVRKSSELADAGHYTTSIRDLGDRTIIEPDQIRRLFKHLGIMRA